MKLPPAIAPLALGIVALAVGALVAGCGVDDCSTVCQQQRGFWRPQAGCADPELAALGWEVALSAHQGQCDVISSWCERTEPKATRGVRDCASQLSYAQLGAAVCSIRIEGGGVTAVCRMNGKTCDFTLVQTAAPTLSCAPVRDAGADRPVDAAVDAPPPSG